MIKIYSTKWCGDCIRTKAFLDEKEVSYQEIDIQSDEEARKKIIEINNGNASTPTLIFDDGSTMTEPSNQELIDKLNL